ncbi:MAG: phosphatase PAP2 family protein [Muribaculaceae bacterium]|nr:phosphatase PAP2 family protein [Muribaculaceae bacterium]
MLERLIHIDNELLLMLNGMHLPYLDNFMMLFTGRFVWVPMYAMLLFVIIRNNRPKRAVWTACVIVLAIVIADQTCSHVLRPLVERLRPSNPSNPISELVTVVNGYRGGLYGFPSCHAANSFALAMITSLIVRSRRLSWFIFIWATLNSYSRLYLGVHYPGDLLAGAVIGCCSGALCYALWRGVSREKAQPDKIKGRLRSSDLVIISGLLVTAVIAAASI